MSIKILMRREQIDLLRINETVEFHMLLKCFENCRKLSCLGAQFKVFLSFVSSDLFSG